MTSWLETCKPGASSRVQLWLAAAMWSFVGMGLFSVGAYWLLTPAEVKGWIIMLVAVVLGTGKSSLVLDRTADGIVDRIKLRGEGRCAGGFLSPRIWILVLGMMFLGKLLRTIGLPRPLLGLIYAAVGTGLLFSSRIIWRAWKNH